MKYSMFMSLVCLLSLTVSGKYVLMFIRIKICGRIVNETSRYKLNYVEASNYRLIS